MHPPDNGWGARSGSGSSESTASAAESTASSELLTTFAPIIERPASLHPTGNLLVALPEIDDRGRCRSIGIVSEADRGVVAALDDHVGVLAPLLVVDGVPLEPDFSWAREADWLPHAQASVGGGRLSAQWVAPVSSSGTSDAGIAARLTFASERSEPAEITLQWHGAWGSTTVHHFRAKELPVDVRTRDDPWTGTRTAYVGIDRLLLAVARRPGEGGEHEGDAHSNSWAMSLTAVVEPGATLTFDVYLGVAPEPDGAGATALYLRRRGFDALHADTVTWLESHGPRLDDVSLSAGDRPGGLESRMRLNAFFCHFYSQADCLDTGRTVMLTSRSPRYYVSGAFWSRDAYWWSFPALLLTDARRARRALVESIATAGGDVAHHALYITGTRLYPGFELDELCAPWFAVWRYVDTTGDRSVLDEPAVRRLVDVFDCELADVHDSHLDLYATTLLPTDDPSEFAFTATNNAFVAVAFQIIGRLLGDDARIERGVELTRSLRRHFVHDRDRDGDGDGDDGGRRWAWAIDHDGAPEWRDEAPLGLRTLRYWGVIDTSDDHDEAAMTATERWLVTDYPYHFDGPFPGAGAPHFTSPSAFDLANRILTANDDLGDPLAALVETPLDNGLGCESWDPTTGSVATGAAMSSVAGFLVWTAWAACNGHRRWDDPFLLPAPR